MLLGTLVATVLGNMLTGKGFIRAGYGSNNERNQIVRAGYGLNKVEIPPHPSVNFEIQNLNGEFKSNGEYSKDNLPKKGMMEQM